MLHIALPFLVDQSALEVKVIEIVYQLTYKNAAPYRIPPGFDIVL